mmetsp:Transcript_493/g.1388  ORF Transcript_493/g.1388 Transcript_493/m.1388 type:complete len:233 (-) Transcript_493:274-972(-)
MHAPLHCRCTVERGLVSGVGAAVEALARVARHGARQGLDRLHGSRGRADVPHFHHTGHVHRDELRRRIAGAEEVLQGVVVCLTFDGRRTRVLPRRPEVDAALRGGGSKEFERRQCCDGVHRGAVVFEHARLATSLRVPLPHRPVRRGGDEHVGLRVLVHGEVVDIVVVRRHATIVRDHLLPRGEVPASHHPPGIPGEERPVWTMPCKGELGIQRVDALHFGKGGLVPADDAA